MKKVLLILGIVFTYYIGMSQTRFGLQAGVNISNFAGDISGGGSHLGFRAGGLVNLPLGSGFSLQPELSFTNLGASRPFGNKETLNYIPLTLLGKYTFSGSLLSFYLGPELGILAGSSVPTDSSGVKDQFQSTAVWGIFGTDYVFHYSPVFLSARYQVGLSNILQNGGARTLNVAGFVFMVGYKFGPLEKPMKMERRRTHAPKVKRTDMKF